MQQCITFKKRVNITAVPLNTNTTLRRTTTGTKEALCRAVAKLVQCVTVLAVVLVLLCIVDLDLDLAST